MGDIFNNGIFVSFFTVALSGLGVLMAYAIASRFYQADTMRINPDDFNQVQYMRAVRLRYQGSMANANGYGRKWLQITGQDGGPGMGGGHAHRESGNSYV